MNILRLLRRKRSFVFFAALLFPLFSGLALINYAVSPIDSQKNVYTVDIPKGASFLKIVDILHDAGLVKQRALFYTLALLKNATGHIRAGEYEIATSMSPSEMLRKIVRGEIKGYLVTITEDMTTREIAARLASYRLVNYRTFMNLAVDEEFLASLYIEGPSLEGFLYPETYRLDRSMGEKEIIRTMVRQFWKNVTPEMLSRAEQLGLTIVKFVTLASIIGKESGNKEEKPLVSAVFHNRLKKGMKLQSDPTAVYEMDNFDGTILKKHLQNNSPFNTYRINGLPPSPIANPGIDSLYAALHPADVNYLYFVAKNDGTHFFSFNLATHNEATLRYRMKR